MVVIIRMYLFDGIEHETTDSERDLERDAFLIMEKVEMAPIAMTIKSRYSKINNNPYYVEIIETLKKSGNCEIIIDCKTVDLA